MKIATIVVGAIYVQKYNIFQKTYLEFSGTFPLSVRISFISLE